MAVSLWFWERRDFIHNHKNMIFAVQGWKGVRRDVVGCRYLSVTFGVFHFQCWLCKLFSFVLCVYVVDVDDRLFLLTIHRKKPWNTVSLVTWSVTRSPAKTPQWSDLPVMTRVRLVGPLDVKLTRVRSPNDININSFVVNYNSSAMGKSKFTKKQKKISSYCLNQTGRFMAACTILFIIDFFFSINLKDFLKFDDELFVFVCHFIRIVLLQNIDRLSWNLHNDLSKFIF